MIRKFLAGIIILGFCNDAWSQGRISVRISNFENNKGTCIVCVYDNARSFSEKGGVPVSCLTVPVAGKNATAVFDNLKQGSYAIMVIHDANNNRKFDTNFLGIPKEGYGASQNKLPFAAAPKFEENKIAVTDNATTHCAITLRYIF
ncbi:MAG TPA: DUF2141 domain-containing protein [Flavisolibacter sp.]|jgi:uncharacterized protein (DUF2141 family)|nr:DUF2141 domain-containing protein [Flavisolibacter sp.]